MWQDLDVHVHVHTLMSMVHQGIHYWSWGTYSSVFLNYNNPLWALAMCVDYTINAIVNQQHWLLVAMHWPIKDAMLWTLISWQRKCVKNDVSVTSTCIVKYFGTNCGLCKYMYIPWCLMHTHVYMYMCDWIMARGGYSRPVPTSMGMCLYMLQYYSSTI